MTKEPSTFEEWYFEQWSHGETTPVHIAHKEGCRQAWQAAIRDSNAELIETIRLLEAKADEARARLTDRPSNKVACNIILLQMAQGKFSKQALAQHGANRGEV